MTLRLGAILALFLIAGAYFLGRPGPQEPVASTASAPGSQPAAPAPQASPVAPGSTPAPGTAPAPAASPTPRATGGAVDAGRPDPFAPLVRPVAPGSERPGGVPVPPPAPLPPPLFPGQQPGQPAPPPPPVREGRAAQLMGFVGDGGSAAVIKLGNETFIVSPGELIKSKIRVTVIDVMKRLVILEEEGERFELKMGGVSGAHVAASVSSSFS